MRTALVLLCCLTFACSGPTNYLLAVETSDRLNLDEFDQQPTTLDVHLYVLSEDTAFLAASFEDLWRQESAAKTLGSKLLDMRAENLGKGAKLELPVTLPPEARFVGVLANFNRMDEATTWRECIPRAELGRVKLYFAEQTLERRKDE